MQDSNNTISNVETAILMLLEAKGVNTRSVHRVYPPGLGVRIEDMAPNSIYPATGELEDGSIQFTEGGPAPPMGIKLLHRDFSDIIGETTEICTLDNVSILWQGIRKVKKLHKKAICAERPAHIYEIHQRYYNMQDVTQNTYRKRISAFNKNGDIIPIVIGNKLVSLPNDEYRIMYFATSVLTNSCKPNTILATVREDAEIKFPVHLDSYKDIFAIRDSPLTDSGKRKAIIHWVSEHLRETKKGISTVREHTRGAAEITIAGLTISLKPNPRN